MKKEDTKDAPESGGASAPVVIGKAEVKANYEALVESGVECVKRFQRASVEFWQNIGKLGLELIASSTKYGEKDIEVFAADISKRTGQDVKKDSVYCAVRMCRLMPKKLIERSKEAGIPWRGVQALAAEKLAPEQREKIVDDVLNGRLDKSKVRDAARGIIRGGGGGGGGGGSSTTKPGGTDANLAADLKRFRALPELIMAMGTKLKGTGDALNEVFRGGDVEQMRSGHKTLKELEDAVDSLVTVMDHEYRSARRSYEKVREVVEKPNAKSTK